MASREELATSDSLGVSVVDVPDELLDYVKSSIIEYVSKAEDISAKIHYGEGQSPSMVVSFGKRSAQRATTDDDIRGTNTIVVKNIPSSVDEDLLEIFFESTKKQGGGPVQSVKMLRDMNIAMVEFCDQSSVETVMKKRPIKYGKTELYIQPYKPLLQGCQKISKIDFNGLKGQFTDELVRKHLEYVSGVLQPTYDLIKVGSRVAKGRDWNSQYFGVVSDDFLGTVMKVNRNKTAVVMWDTGVMFEHCIGFQDRYEIKLAS